MNIVDIITAIGSIGGMSGIIALITIFDVKYRHFAENVAKTNDEWQEILKDTKNERDDLREELKANQQRLAELHTKIIEDKETAGELRVRLAKMTTLRCERVECGRRKPPLAGADTTEDTADNE